MTRRWWCSRVWVFYIQVKQDTSAVTSINMVESHAYFASCMRCFDHACYVRRRASNQSAGCSYRTQTPKGIQRWMNGRYARAAGSCCFYSGDSTCWHQRAARIGEGWDAMPNTDIMHCPNSLSSASRFTPRPKNVAHL